MIIDLRSDTVTKPSEAMRETIRNAKVGDDVFGEDPTILALESYVANLLGAEAALFCPTATMSNQIAIKAHTQPMDEIICDRLAHIYQYEVGGYAFLSGCSIRYVNGQYGIINESLVLANINPDDVHKPITRLVCLENTCNKGGGSVYTIAQIEKIKAVCVNKNLLLHLDGARLFNALTYTNEKPEVYGNLFDSITICLSKGLGCPAGALLTGNKNFIKKAKRIRKVFGGGMRQAGILAAAGLFALQNNIERLLTDHTHAKTIADVLQQLPYIVEVLPVHTNIIIFQLHKSLSDTDFIDYLYNKNIMAFAIGGNFIRFVTHLDVTADMLPVVLDALRFYVDTGSASKSLRP